MARRFVDLIDEAIRVAGATAERAATDGVQWLKEDSEMAASNFAVLRERVLKGELPPSGGAGLGITKALGEFAPPELYQAGKAVEDFFRDHWRGSLPPGPGTRLPG